MADPCDRCSSSKVAYVSVKASDRVWFTLDGKEHHGYTPLEVGIDDGDNDYLYFEYCLECGKIQGEFPIPDENLETVFSES